MGYIEKAPVVVKRRKKPVVVETLLWTGENVTSMARFCGNDFRGVDFMRIGRLWNAQECCCIDVPVGHHVVKGRLGEFYPISPEALELTYEEPEEP